MINMCNCMICSMPNSLPNLVSLQLLLTSMGTRAWRFATSRMTEAKTVGWTETETMISTRAETETVNLATQVCSSITAVNQMTETARFGTTDVTIPAGSTMTRARST